MRIEIDDLTRPEILALLNEHLTSMHRLSLPESVHALDVSKLKSPDITFWTAWSGDLLMGCAALKQLTSAHGEVKSMRTPAARRGQGAARCLLEHIVGVARERHYGRLSLETGAQEAFLPAQTLYRSFGFIYCGPFGNYKADPNSVFMSLPLS